MEKGNIKPIVFEIEYGKPIRASEYKKISQEDLAKELHDWIQSRIDISPEDK